ncbi:MAG: CHAT domain-containing protein [Saprospiraceae bacterium]|nr:CHAT domain-containing protein [Saprospiraceae bacterium]
MRLAALFLIQMVATQVVAQSVDSVIIKQVDSLILVSRDLTAKGDYDHALEVNAAAEKLVFDKLGLESASYGSCTFNKGRIHDFMGNNQEAEKWYLESKAIREKVLGREHLDYAQCLKNLAGIYLSLGNFEKAEPLILESLSIREKVFGKEHLEYFMGLFPLLELYKGLGNLGKAEQACLQMLEICEKTVGKESVYFASCLIELGNVYSKMELYDKAEPLFYQSIGIQDRLIEKNNSLYNWSKNNLALMLWKMGQFEKAEVIYLELISQHVISNSQTHPAYISYVSNLAILYDEMGLHEKAQLLLLESKSIYEKSLNTESPDYARALMNLAISYSRMANYVKAEQLFIQSKTIVEVVSGKEHPIYESILNNLAIVYVYTKNYSKAQELYLEAISIVEKKEGRNSTLYAQLLNNLANVNRDSGNFEGLEALYQESLDIYKHLRLNDHPNYANCLKNMADWYLISNRLSKAEPLYLESKSIIRRMVDTTHYYYSNIISELATLYFRLGQLEKAENYFHELSDLNRIQLEKSSRYLSELELSSYMDLFKLQQNRILSFTQNTGNSNSIQLCYNNSLFYKGFLLHESNRIKRLALSDSTATEKFYMLKSCCRRLASEYSKLIVDRDSIMIIDLEEKANALEKDLIRTVTGFDRANRQVRWQDVQSALKPGEIAIEMVHYNYYQKLQTDSTFYAALVILPGREMPLFISLFEENELKHLLDTEQERKSDYVNNLYARVDRGMIQQGIVQKSLYDLIWARIEAAGLEGIKTVYYSPSGVLHRLNLGAIAVDDETILSDRYNLVALNSTRQLVIPAAVITLANDALLVGGVNFEVDTTYTTFEEPPLLTSRSAGAWTTSGTRGGNWPYLKWTEKEVERITSTLTTEGFKAAQLTGSEAAEEAIKAIGRDATSPRILHIATHGFFFTDPEVKMGKQGLGETEPVFKNSDNPMIRSGLILAGGNYTWQYGHAFNPEKEDGILTAYEISQMNLSNTELVVLSACETGLGDIQGNEGVYGLQRAFKIAGAKYLIMSLWQVPDRETMEFMTAFIKIGWKAI